VRSGHTAQRGSIAVELGIALPFFMLIVAGGLSLGRALVTKHNLESAVTNATRTAAVGNIRDQGAIHNLINDRLGNERVECTGLNTRVQVIASTGPGTPEGLEVIATCDLVPMFNGLIDFGVDHITVVVAMPLPILEQNR